MKLIVSCFSCSPTRGSEPGMGWGYLRAIAQDHDIWALVDGWEFGEELRKYQAEHPEELRRVHFIFVPCKPHPLLRRIWPPSYYWFYNLWHRRAFKIAQRLHEEVHFDAAWKLSMVTYREPGYLWKLPIPFVWGPVGALGYTDRRLFPLLGWRGKMEYSVRNVINWWQSHFLVRPRRAAQKAAATRTLFAATGENLREMKRLWGVDSEVLCEIGLRELPSVQMRDDDECLKIFWSGVFERRKALPLLLMALSCFEGRWTLDVVGDGPMRRSWMSLSDKLRLAKHVTWHGWRPRREALTVLQRANVAVVTSLHDLTSTVLVEALAYGKPVVCLRHCGFADAVDETCGIPIAIDRSEDMVNAFTEALLRLKDPALRKELSRGARKRAEMYVWKNKMKRLHGIIERIFGHA